MSTIRVTVWGENHHDQTNPTVQAIYPQGMHGCIAASLRKAGCEARTATLDQPEHGLTDAVLAETDVLVWWGHCKHDAVDDAIVKRVQQRVLGGMGFIALHSAHYSKPFIALMGTNCSLRWREVGEKERIFTIEQSHPIAAGLPDSFELPHEEMYGERFDIPTPDELVFISWFEGGDVFRSGCTWRRGHGRVFYFRPGHETYPTYHDKNIQRIIANAARWAAQRLRRNTDDSPEAAQPFEQVRGVIGV
jgi:trehalose utilization protein